MATVMPKEGKEGSDDFSLVLSDRKVMSLSKLSKALKVSSSLSTARGRIVHNGEAAEISTAANCRARDDGEITILVDVGLLPNS